MAIYRNGREKTAWYYLGRAVQRSYRYGRLAWEYIKGFIFTSDGRALKTSDGYIVKCKDQ